MRRAALALTLSVMGCGGSVEPCAYLQPGHYEMASTVEATTCATEHVGDQSTGVLDMHGCQQTASCTTVCDTGPTSTEWRVTSPGHAEVTFKGDCTVVYGVTLFVTGGMLDGG